MNHESLGLLSGTFRGSQQRWATVDEKRFAIVSLFCRLEYMLRGGMHIYTDHHNLAYIFEPETCILFLQRQRELEDGARAVRLYDHAYFW